MIDCFAYCTKKILHVVIKRIYILYLFILSLSQSIYSQTIQVRGIISSEKGQVINGATILANDKIVAISDFNGYFSFQTGYQDTILLNIRHIGYAAFDYTVIPQKGKSFYNLKITLKDVTVELSEIMIESKAVYVFDKKDWIILDYLVYDSTIVVLSKEFKDIFLYTFEYSGKLISKEKLSYPYKSLYISCLGGLHLIGKEQCQEFEIEDGDIYFNDIYQTDKFYNFIKPCCLVYKNTPVFKDFLNHNQKAVYYYFDDSKTNQHKIFIVFNELNSRSVNKVYNRIISLYYYSISHPQMSDISYDFDKENIIEAGDWDGDLMKLAISDSLFDMISNFINIESKPVNTHLDIIEDKLFLFDFSNNRILNLGLDGKIISNVKINNNKCKRQNIVKDVSNDKVYLVCNEQSIFKLNYQTGETDLVFSIPEEYLFPKRIKINSGDLFFINYDYAKYSYNQLVKTKLIKTEH